MYTGLPVICFYECRHIAATIMLFHGITQVIVAGVTPLRALNPGVLPGLPDL
jgi:hypothetical protein